MDNCCYSWITNERQNMVFCRSKGRKTTRFFCITADVGSIYVGVVGSDYSGFMTGVYAVDYGAGSWSSKMTGIAMGTDYPMFVGMATNDINIAYLAGSNASGEPIVLKTTTAGAGWNPVFNTTNNLNINTGWSGDGAIEVGVTANVLLQLQ